MDTPGNDSLELDSDDPAFGEGFDAGCHAVPEWVRGFECGIIWRGISLMVRDARREGGEPGVVKLPVRTAITEMVMRMCEAAGLTFRAEALDDKWTMITLRACRHHWEGKAATP